MEEGRDFMNEMPLNSSPNGAVFENPTKPKKTFPPVLIGILYMIGHYVLMTVISFVALGVCVVKAIYQAGILQNSSVNEETYNDVLGTATELLYANSELVTLITQIVTVIVVLVIFFIIRRRKKEEKPSSITYFSLKKVSPMMILMSALIAFCAYFTVSVFIGLIGELIPDLVDGYNGTMEEALGNTNLVIQFLTLVVGAPVCEELIYRNMAITNMNKRLSPMIAILISSSIFGLVHGSLLQIIYAAALGFVFGVLFVRTESIFPSLTAHAVFNAMGFGLPLLAEHIGNNSVGEAVLNTTVGILTLVSLLVAPLLVFWVLKHTDRPLRVKMPRVKRVPVAPQTPPYMPQGPYPPQNPPYGYPPYPRYGQPPSYPPYPNGWVFDQRYGWIWVGQPPQYPYANGEMQNPITPNSTPDQPLEKSTDDTDKTGQ